MLSSAGFVAGLGLALILITPSVSDAQNDVDVSAPICTDRPTKANYACPVDAGDVQYEADIVNASVSTTGGVTTNSWLIVNPTLKYGLGSDMDVEANISPLDIVRTRDASGDVHTLSGVSDLYLRMKWEFLDTVGGVLQATLLPYVKAPTARQGIGNGAVEGGAIIPINYKLSNNLTLTVDPEVDLLKDAVGDGRHLNTAQLVNIGLGLPHSVTVYGELWADWNFDPAGLTRQYSADTAVSYGVTPRLQLDAGVNFGLNRSTPDVQAYLGISQKF